MQRSTHRASREGSDAGFSLVEMLIVIVVLGILATVTVFAVHGVTDRGEESSCQEDARIMHTAAESYFAQVRDPLIAVSDPAVAGITGTTAELTLVERGFLHAPSTLHDVDADGVVTAQAGSRCT